MSKSVQELSEALARTINMEALRNPQSPYMGKFLLIVDGKGAGVSDTLDDLMRGFEKSGVDPSRSYCIEIGIDYDEPQDIWDLR